MRDGFEEAANVQPVEIVSEHYAELPQEPSTNWTSNGLGRVASRAIVWCEIFPATNEIPRLAAAVGAHILFHDPAVTAGVVGLSTFAIEGGGSVVTADLLDTDWIDDMRDKKLTGKLLKRIDKFTDSHPIEDTNPPIDFAIAMTLGTPADQITKHYLNPERTRRQNRMYGMLLSLGTSAVLAAESYLIDTGIVHPSKATIPVAVTALAGLGVAYKWAKQKVLRATNSNNDNEKSEPA